MVGVGELQAAFEIFDAYARAGAFAVGFGKIAVAHTEHKAIVFFLKTDIYKRVGIVADSVLKRILYQRDIEQRQNLDIRVVDI